MYARIACRSKNNTSNIDSNLCPKVRHKLRQSLQDFVRHSEETPRTGTAFDMYIQCPSMNIFQKNEGMLRVAQFNYESELDCEACSESHPVERSEALQYWLKN
ncbi:hypothetical protein DPMN_051481 [Dreissena polymorpha]|uniref:Uncharacterized protein n=1 Tax=Dreissena polymorpha TaxID=45954 RepID=A0A9D4CJI4_DREPO|nr:hypothetical protein DPMN_051481 [Dreissena polymorpha]